MFKGFYDYSRFGFLHSEFENSDLIDSSPHEIVPKTACFFSEKIDAYIDTSDGVNDDLGINEYCGRIFACSKLSSGKKFLFFKSAYSPIWSKNISKVAEENNGTVIPFFKWSFNHDFYSHTLPNLKELRSLVDNTESDIDLGLFADFQKKYTYPKPSSNDSRLSIGDINKFKLHEYFGPETSANKEKYNIGSREKILNQISKSDYSVYHGSLPYKEYINKSAYCKGVLNPPGVGEYTSRMIDQTAIGNLIILRKNSYDNGISWKNHIPEVDFTSNDWNQQIDSIIENREEWREKGRQYFDEVWSPPSVFKYFIDKIEEVI